MEWEIRWWVLGTPSRVTVHTKAYRIHALAFFHKALEFCQLGKGFLRPLPMLSPNLFSLSSQLLNILGVSEQIVDDVCGCVRCGVYGDDCEKELLIRHPLESHICTYLLLMSIEQPLQSVIGLLISCILRGNHASQALCINRRQEPWDILPGSPHSFCSGMKPRG